MNVNDGIILFLENKFLTEFPLIYFGRNITPNRSNPFFVR